MAVGLLNEAAALTGFSYKKMYGCFAGKKGGCNNEVKVRRGSAVFFDTGKQLAHLSVSIFKK